MKEKLILILVIVVFGAGFGIYIWNFVNGRDLAKTPNFDLSAYDNVAELKAIGAYLEGKDNAVNTVTSATKEETSTVPVLSTGYVYFHASLEGATFVETKKMVGNFLQDFPLLGKMSANAEYFGYSKSVEVALPIETQKSNVTQMKKNKEVESVNSKDNINFEVAFKTELSFAEIESFLVNYPEAKLKTPLVRDKNYIARLSYGDKLPLASELARLRQDFSDIVTVKE